MADHGAEEPPHFRATYNDIHNLIRARAPQIQAEFRPDMFIAIGACALLWGA
jgi:hypoxanthine phosphoribosyltransferase